MTTLDFISCANCGEPLDGEQPSCPMCGAVISPETIAELVLPKPEEVVIEVQTAEHLRFRLPSRPPKERWTIAFILFSCGGFLIYKFGKILFHIGIVLDSRIINLDIILPMFFFLIGFIPCVCGVFAWGNTGTIELDPQWLTIRYSMGPLYLKNRLSTERIKQVFCHVKRSALILETHCVTSGSKVTSMLVGHPPATARHVTQLIRRQLKTMGHKLPKEA